MDGADDTIVGRAYSNQGGFPVFAQMIFTGAKTVHRGSVTPRANVLKI